MLRRIIAPLAIFCVALWLAIGLVPIPVGLSQPPADSAQFVDRDGRPLRQLLAENGSFSEQLTIDQVSREFIDATLAAEDKRFFNHPGVDFLAVGRAIFDSVRRHRITSGASTITQQLVKLSNPANRHRTVGAKIFEAAQALRLERSWSKSRILEAYLNRLDYGNLRIGAASADPYYFGKPLRDLSAAESAFLAGLPQSPTRFNPYLRLQAAKNRQQTALHRMAKNGALSEQDFHRALVENLRLQPARRVFQAPHFVDLLLRQNRLTDGGEIRTTLDLELNQRAEIILHDQLSRLKNRHLADGAIVVIENRTGNVLALVGSQNYFAPGSGQVNGATAARSAGSTFKPFTYLLAFERGATPASVVADLPVEFPTASGIYRPENYNHRCYGPMRYRLALANSLNISAVKVLESIGGAAPLQKRLSESGLTTLTKSAEHYGLGLTIGNAETRLIELTNAYACLARMGEFKPYRLLADAQPDPTRQVCDPDAAYLVADILSDNSARTVAFGRQSSMRFDFPVACKTGTSTDFRDNWAVGYTPEFTVGVWVGNFDGSPMDHVSGVTGAAPILHGVFEFLHQSHGTSWYQMPSGIVEKTVHSITGKLVGDNTSDSVREKFARKFLPMEQPPGEQIRLEREYTEWMASGSNWVGNRAIIDPAITAQTLRVASPLPGTIYILDPDLPARSQLLPLVAHSANVITWKSDSLELHTEHDKTFARLTEGRHALTALDQATGEKRETWLIVKSY